MTTTEMTPQEQRAYEYIRIFVAAGERWRDCVPVDGRDNGRDSVRIGGVPLTCDEHGHWGMPIGGRYTRFEKASTKAVAPERPFICPSCMGDLDAHCDAWATKHASRKR